MPASRRSTTGSCGTIVGLREMPARGADFFLADRRVVDAFLAFPERTTSVFNQLTWMGFRQEYVEYDKQPRAAGASGWTLARKIRLVVDSVTAFSNAPLRWCAYFGAAMLVVALALTIVGISLLPAARGRPPVVLAVFVGLSGVQMLALATVGEYVWSALAEARRRPQYVIEAATSDDVVEMTDSKIAISLRTNRSHDRLHRRIPPQSVDVRDRQVQRDPGQGTRRAGRWTGVA